jgi:dihydrofolate reductase (trimethoprim resistance protein)
MSFPDTHKTFAMGDRVQKKSGSQWHGYVVGWYSTKLTPEGYAVESSSERGSVQIYPVAALELIERKEPGSLMLRREPVWDFRLRGCGSCLYSDSLGQPLGNERCGSCFPKMIGKGSLHVESPL